MESRETSVVTPNHHLQQQQQQQHHHYHQQNNTTSGSTGQLSSSGGGSLSGASGVISGGGTTATGAGMHHSLSTPAGVDGGGGANGGGTRTPPATPKKGGKMLAIRVQMLDDTITIFQVQAKAMGRVLFDQVCKQLHLLEADYFGLEYQDLSGTRYWLDLQKPISRQLGLSLVDPLLHFCVKFYTPDPGQLEEEYTRYLYCLQVKRDLAAPSTTSVSTQTGAGSGATAAGGGCLQWCNDNTAALMASYIVQAECGDYVAEDYPDHTYLSSYKFVPHQDRDMERRIMENHKKHAGQSPAEADLNLLETARRCELYGVKMHPAKDHENVSLNLAVAHMGIVVFQHFTKINTFSWAKIRKISFKRKRFLIKLHPEGYGYYKDTVEFFFEGRNECKNFWKKCVENHGFFRCAAVKNISRHKTRVLSRGSSFRYSGKTQKQIVEFVRDNYVKRQTFQRSASFRHSSAHSSANNMHASTVGNSLSAHPLLPLADTNLSAEASKRSASVGAMGENSPTTTTTGLPPLSSSVASAPPPPFSETSAMTTTSSSAADITMRNITAANTISNTGDNTTTEAVAASRTTRSVSHHHGTPMSWSTDRDIRKPIAPPAQTMSSPSPPLTMQSVSPITSTTTSPQHPPVSVTPPYANNNLELPASPPAPPPPHHTPVVAVHAAVHRADTTTGTQHNTTNTIRTSSNLKHPLPTQTQSQNDLDTTNNHHHPHHHHNHHYVHIHHHQVPQISEILLPAFDLTLNTVINTDDLIVAPVQSFKRHIWQRSASCRDLYDFSFEDSGQAKRRVVASSVAVTKPQSIPLKVNNTQNSNYHPERTLESPITRYDDHSALYVSSARNSSLEIHQDIMMPDQKVYSSSYPGTTSYSQESVEDPGNYDLRDSQEDISHDSYELIERSDDDYSTSGAEGKYAKAKIINTRSCSLDSGNYLPSDSDSESAKQQKCKSSSDVFAAIEDPRDFPREIIPRRSDGNFYKTFKQGSRTSSLESKSDYYESKASKSSKESLKKTHKRRRSVGSRTSSQESSKSDYDNKLVLPKLDYDSRSSCESKSEYYDAEIVEEKPAKYTHEYDRKIQFERNYGTQKPPPETCQNGHPLRETHVHSISLQNVETEQQLRTKRLASLDQNTLPRTQRPAHHQFKACDSDEKVTHIWPESITGMSTQIKEWPVSKQSTRSTESESNIFSFDEDKIQSYQESEVDLPEHSFTMIPSTVRAEGETKKNYRDVFVEIEPRKLDLITREPLPLHQPIERTKSDPNNLARQRINSNSRRLLLKHQKSIDLTPAESSDEDYLYKQIPSAPPIMKYRGTGTHFEMPSAEFGHFDILKREVEGQKSKFEVPKRQFQELGAKTQSDFTNLPRTSDADIPYVLHKRHVMNGTSKEEEKPREKWNNGAQEVPRSPKDVKVIPKSPVIIEPDSSSSFLFTQNIDLSKLDPVTLEIDKTIKPIQHLSSPKRDITRIDPVLLEALNSKLSQIESDSPTSSRTDSIKPTMKAKIMEITVEESKLDVEKNNDNTGELVKPKIIIRDKIIKTDNKPKRIIKPRMQPGKKSGIKSNKTKVRITSFSSDDESLDSDDVFGSAEATPTKIEFSPPQMRKEMESILKYESERKYLQYTMSSTEIEGSPPTTRKSDMLYDRTLDPAYQTELRRISERSLSIPSSEEDFNIKASDLQPVFDTECAELTTVEELDKEEYDKSVDDTIEQVTIQELIREEDLLLMDEEKEKEKQLLNEDIERDIKELTVPSRTTLTEICSPSSRRKGHSPHLFAHARLNLSEGSAFSLLQKQEATESPLPERRTKSLDTPIIPLNKLPPLDSFSSKDDTVDEEPPGLYDYRESFTETEDEVVDILVESDPPNPDLINDKPPLPVRVSSKEPSKGVVKTKSLEKDQIVPDLCPKTKKAKKPTEVGKTTVTKSSPSKSKATFKINKSSPSKTPLKDKTKSVVALKSLPLKAVKPDTKTISPPKTEEIIEKQTVEDIPLDDIPPDIREDKPKSLPIQTSLALPEIKRTKSQEIETCKRPPPAEKAKSLEKIEFKRTSSKERTKSQDESDTDIAKRKEKQQLLYEIAIKQTLKSPVKDTLPVFPQVEEMVRERHGKLEISINTIDTAVNLEDAIIITKSPKKLDKKMDKKMTKSLELNLTDDEEAVGKSMCRLGKSLDMDAKTDSLEFDFKSDAVNVQTTGDETSPESDNIEEQLIDDINEEIHSEISEKVDTDTEETLQDVVQDNVILEGTSLDVWLTVDEKPSVDKKLEDITVLKESTDFFEPRPVEKPPDLPKLLETKSSSDSTSVERMSLGNSLDIKFIDDSGDSSHKSDQDAQLALELQKASKTVEKHLLKKLALRRKPQFLDLTSAVPDEIDNALVRITSEEESLTEVSELKDQDTNFLGVAGAHGKDSLLKLSIERSRSEENTGSWMTVDCDEFIGVQESFEDDNVSDLSPEKDKETKITATKEESVSSNQLKPSKIDLLKRSSDQSRSSDTTGSWTSGEKDTSPGKTGDESSVSYSVGKTIGLSQTIEKFATRDQLDKTSPDEIPRSPRSPRICVLGRAFTIDEGMEMPDFEKKSDEESSTETANDIPHDLPTIQEASTSNTEEDDSKNRRKPYPFDEKWSNDSELSQKLHQKLTKKLSSADKSSLSSMDEGSERRARSAKNSFERPSIHSVENLSVESRNSIDTESSSGSFGMATRLQKTGGESPGIGGMSSTWKPFPLESSASSSLEEGLPPDHEMYGQEYFLSRENSGEFSNLTDIHKVDLVDLDLTPTRDLLMADDIMGTFSYANLGLGSDIIVNTGFGPSFLSRTLSRISERSTNSEKSSVDEDSTKASTQSSLHEESASSEARGSNSSDPEGKKIVPPSEKKIVEQYPNVSNLLQRQISDDRRTSAEMADLSIDDIEIITSERGLKLRRQDSDDTIIDEESLTSERKEKRDSSSQESDEWPLPDIPLQRPLMALHETPSTDTSQPTTQVFQPSSNNIPKVFGLKGSLKSQESEQWPSPPSSIIEPLIIGNVETHYITPPEEACKVLVDSNTVSTYDNDSNSFSDSDNKTLEDLEEGEKTHTYENVATEHNSESISESFSAGLISSGVKIVLDPRNDSGESHSDELNVSNLNDDVFVDAAENVTSSRNELRPPTAMRRSTTSDDSSHSGNRGELKVPSPKGSHSSYSDEEATSSMGTNLEDGTVRYALKPSKCTHSSHSEDTSIALSLSEWSNSTTTVKFQNLSTSKSATNSSGLKSDDNSLTDIAQSISEWSSSNSTLKAQSIQFQKMSSSTGDSSTLTEMLPTLSEWPTPDNKTKQFFAAIPERSITRMGSSIDEADLAKSVMSPQIIPSENLQLQKDGSYLKSTERPMLIPAILSDNEKSTESSSMEQKTVHNLLRNDKQKYLKHQLQSKSTERPVKVPLKLSKCSPYYSSSLSSESTPMTTTSTPIALGSKTATIPLTRTHRKPPVARGLFQARSPPSENDSTSSMESARTKSEPRDRRGHRRRRQTPQRRQKSDKDLSGGGSKSCEPPHYRGSSVDPEASEYNEYIRNRSMEELSRAYYTEGAAAIASYSENLEEGYYPDGDSQSGSDIFRMERDDEEKYEHAEGGFDVSSIPPPLLEDDFEIDKPDEI